MSCSLEQEAAASQTNLCLVLARQGTNKKNEAISSPALDLLLELSALAIRISTTPNTELITIGVIKQSTGESSFWSKEGKVSPLSSPQEGTRLGHPSSAHLALVAFWGGPGRQGRVALERQSDRDEPWCQQTPQGGRAAGNADFPAFLGCSSGLVLLSWGSALLPCQPPDWI